MKILVISWYFPPANDVAALRVGKMVEYLRDAGHDVWVLTGDRKHPDESLCVPLPPDRIVRAPWFDVDLAAFPWRWKRMGEYAPQPATADDGNSGIAPRRHRVVNALDELYINLVRIPDQQIGWLPYALRAGTAFLKQHPIDLIYASGPPFTAFLAANSFSRRFGIPWVAEYRDGWSRYVYAPKPGWRQVIDAFIEARVVRKARLIVAVSEPWAAYYRDRFNLPAIAVYNGFDAENLVPATQRDSAPDQPLSITYMGGLYGGLRDPSVLYQGITRSKLTPKDLQVYYYGPHADDVYPLAREFGVSDFVKIKDRVSYRRSLEIERGSDVLLLLQSPKDPRNIPAKIFEYLASCRPILGLGLDEGIPATLIRERCAGLYVTDADVVAAQLKQWVAQKKATGVIPNLPPSVHAGLSRVQQFWRLADFLLRAAQKNATI